MTANYEFKADTHSPVCGEKAYALKFQHIELDDRGDTPDYEVVLEHGARETASFTVEAGDTGLPGVRAYHLSADAPTARRLANQERPPFYTMLVSPTVAGGLAVTSMLGYRYGTEDVHVPPSSRLSVPAERMPPGRIKWTDRGQFNFGSLVVLHSFDAGKRKFHAGVAIENMHEFDVAFVALLQGLPEAQE